jgi:hypothetical protein
MWLRGRLLQEADNRKKTRKSENAQVQPDPHAIEMYLALLFRASSLQNVKLGEVLQKHLEQQHCKGREKHLRESHGQNEMKEGLQDNPRTASSNRIPVDFIFAGAKAYFKSV